LIGVVKGALISAGTQAALISLGVQDEFSVQTLLIDAALGGVTLGNGPSVALGRIGSGGATALRAADTAAGFGHVKQPVTIIGENMRDRVIPFAEKTQARPIPFARSVDEWTKLSPQEQYRLNDGALRSRIRAGDRFRYIGQDPYRDAAVRRRFDLTRSELDRLQERGIDVEFVSRDEIYDVLRRP
jgi:hypothetical protein